MDRLQRPPLSGQVNNAERMQSLHAEAGELRRRMNPTAALAAVGLYQSALQRSPQDHWLVQNFAEFPESTGDLKAAAAQWQRVCDLLPQDCLAHYQAGRLLSRLDQWPEAEAALTKAVALRPRLAEAWYELGNVHLGTGRFEPALSDYERAFELDRLQATYASFPGKALSKLNRHAEALQHYKQALRLRPKLWETRFALADELAAVSRFAEAGSEYAEVVRLKPGDALAHLDLGVMQARLGRYDEALQQFEETVRLDPGNPQVREYLVRVQGWKNQRR
ncbi:MAG TPA: tetratricopeptide repeat protein [Verrucomicrobiae bacterium]|nr:tetratricopeptide repeat protein [Verrucomicrobiae bacterium]